MTDLMNGIEYEKACRYRLRETLENVDHLLESSEEPMSGHTLEKSLMMLENAVEELKYFREKIKTTGSEFEGIE